eukprot:GEMP01127214.1.p1 GENE.GEMP01127214.1~~GEMP01127214.1.p1  ORF type:complete len:109 (-),score=1.69 GEMP01127214.1:121-447(-)
MASNVCHVTSSYKRSRKGLNAKNENNTKNLLSQEPLKKAPTKHTEKAQRKQAKETPTTHSNKGPLNTLLRRPPQRRNKKEMKEKPTACSNKSHLTSVYRSHCKDAIKK